MGEEHTLNKQCPTNIKSTTTYDLITDMGLNMLKTKKCLDLFLEGQYTHIYGQNIDFDDVDKKELEEYRKQSREMSNSNIGELGYVVGKNIRIHYIDPRQIFNGDDQILYPVKVFTSFFPELNNINIREHLDMSINEFKKLNIEEIIKLLIDPVPNKSKRMEFIKLVDLINLSVKIINKYKHKKIKECNSEWILYYIPLIMKEYKKLSYIDKEIFTKTLFDTYKENYLDKIDKIDNIDNFEKYTKKYIPMLMALPMDVYSLCRLFIKFNKSRKNIELCNIETINNVIIYGGSAHIENYNVFLLKLKSNLIYENIHPYNDLLCLLNVDLKYIFI